LIVEMCQNIRRDTALATVALSGGCFQNRLLFGQTVSGLLAIGFRVLVHQRVPTNDGGISLGQAMIANVRDSNGR
jgi:hydrogenase maturation protein HypF